MKNPIEVNLIFKSLFGSWTSKNPQTIHNLINWIWKAFFIFAHSTLSLDIYLMENLFAFQACKESKIMKIDGKFDWKIFEDLNLMFLAHPNNTSKWANNL
jgi:hypothetical protein